MKTIVTTVMALLVSISALNAQSNQKELLKKSHKLTYEDFAQMYGENDTAMAIIDVFFNKRESASTYMSFLPISAAITPLSPLAGGLSIIVTSPLFAKGAIMRMRYNKRKLNKVLQQFENNEDIADNIERKYKKMLVIYQIEEAELMAFDEEGVEIK
jgi:uncharacterized protein YdaL